METESKQQKKSTNRADYEERKKNAQARYMEDTRKQYLLASSKESLQMLIERQREELTRVLIELKSEYDLLTRESHIKEGLIKEYDIKIKMIQTANDTNQRKQDDQKETTEQIKEGIDLKKEKKGEELYIKKTLEKQVEKLNKDLFIIQKQIVKCENESELLDKKKERAKLDENLIREKGNQVYSKIENQNKKNEHNQNEHDLQVEYYETVIKQKYMFMQFADERKERQKKIEQEAKNDAQDKQEVEKRKTLELLLLYNQYLRKVMAEQLKKYEDLEEIYEEIRDICGTQDLKFIVDFILYKDKRYNFECQVIDTKEKKISELKEQIKELKNDLINVRNDMIVSEKTDDARTEATVEDQGLETEQVEILKVEKEKNNELLLLGKKYNDIILAYNKVLENIKNIHEYEIEHPLNIKQDKEQAVEKKDEELVEDKEEQNEDSENVKKYAESLNRILKGFEILCLCRPKQEFLNLMREKGISSQSDKKESGTKIVRSKGRRVTKRGLKNDKSARKTTENTENNKNDGADEEDDISNVDPDKKILNRFMREQKKEIDDFINFKEKQNALAKKQQQAMNNK